MKIYGIFNCIYFLSGQMYILISSLQFFLDPAAPAIFLYTFLLVGCTFTNTSFTLPPTHAHIGFLFLSGYSTLQAFCVQMAPEIINKLCNYHEGSQRSRKNKGWKPIYLHRRQSSKHRCIKTRPEEQWLCCQEQGAMVHSASL